MHNGIFDGTLTAGAIEGEPYCEFSNPVASALKPFSNSHSYCVISDPVHWVTEPTPPDENRNFLFLLETCAFRAQLRPGRYSGHS